MHSNRNISERWRDEHCVLRQIIHVAISKRNPSGAQATLNVSPIGHHCSLTER